MHGQNRELIDELVSLSTKYGILTPYTSFLADERVMLHASVANAAMARESLQRAQRGDRPVRRRAAAVQARPHAGRPSGSRAACCVTSFSRRRSRCARPRRSRTGCKPGQRAKPSAGDARAKSRAGRARQRCARRTWPTARSGSAHAAGNDRRRQASRPCDDRKEDKAAADKVRQIGSKTFYWKNERWTDSSVTQEEDEKATVMTQLSDEYFRLARTQKAENNQYLSLDEPVTVKLEGKVYRIEPAKEGPIR